jgi:hypothetical protein
MIWNVGCFYRMGDFLSILYEYSFTKKSLIANFPTFNGVETDRLIEIAFKGKWIKSDQDGVIRISKSGEEIILINHPVIQLRCQIMQLFEKVRPSWAPLLIQGRKAFEAYGPPRVVECFREAHMLDTLEQNVLEWFEQIKSTYWPREKYSQTLTGRKGERLSYIYEEKRTGKSPYWIALDYDGAGYDISSFVSKSDLNYLLIEVKTSTKDWKKASFHLTRNEWDTLSARQNSVLHLWSIAKFPYEHSIIFMKDIEIHIPKNKGKGQWEKFECPYSIFEPFGNVDFSLDCRLD